MAVNVINLISSRQVVATVNEWLVGYVGDRFLAETPILDAQANLWRISVLYVYPNEGPLGSVGEIAIDAATGEVRTHTSIIDIKQKALDLYQSRRVSLNSSS